MNFLRTCGDCTAHLVTGDAVSNTVRCPKCAGKQPGFEQWAAGLTTGSCVYVQPTVVGVWRGRVRHVVLARDGDRFRLAPVGWSGVVETTVGQLTPEPVGVTGNG